MCRPTLLLLLLTSFLTSGSLLAQGRPTFRGSLGLAGGTYTFDSDLAGVRDDADAGLLQGEFEATTRSGLGGGLQYEYFATDRDNSLFRAPGNAFDSGTQARSSTLFAHFTYLVQEHRFRMPIRIGLFVNGLVLDDQGATNPETSYVSAGPMFQIEPELTFAVTGPIRWTIYGQLGFGVGGTSIEVDGDFRDYDSASGFAGVEAGLRARFGPADIGLAYIGRYNSMDRSDVEAGQFVFGYGADFEGVLISAGLTF